MLVVRSEARSEKIGRLGLSISEMPYILNMEVAIGEFRCHLPSNNELRNWFEATRTAEVTNFGVKDGFERNASLIAGLQSHTLPAAKLAKVIL